MSVELNNKTSMRPGFGKKLETPTFNKQSLSSTRGTDSSVFSKTTSLKSSVSQNISSSSLNRSFSTGYTNSGSSVFGQRSANFVPGNHFLGVSDYYNNHSDTRTGINTNTIGYDSQTKGYRSGKHDLELMTGGWTQRSERRAMQRMGMVDLSKLQDTSSNSSKNKMSLLAKIGIGVGIAGLAVGGGLAIANLVKKNKTEKSEEQESDISKLNAQASNNKTENVKTTNAKVDTSVDLSNMSEAELNSTIENLDGKINQLGSDFNTVSNTQQKLEGMTSEQQTQLDTTNEQINQTNNQISQSRNNESSSLMALNAAKDQVSRLEEQLSNPNLSDIQKQTLQRSLEQAEEQVTQKQDQYDKAVQNTANLETQLTELNSTAESLQTSISELKDDLSSIENEQEQIADNLEQASEQKNNAETVLAEKTNNSEENEDKKQV